MRVTCTVRGCGADLEAGAKAWTCPRGHSFDVAKSGYVNLLQPQDRKSVDAGDSKDVVAARRRLFESGLMCPLTETLVELVARTTGSVLDLGCGEGTHIAAIAESRDAWGVDLSIPAIEAAAKCWPRGHWLVLNADRTLCFPDASVGCVLSITGRRNAPEMRRVLAPDGRAIVVVPGERDLAELRAATQADAREVDRLERVSTELAGRFDLLESREISRRATLTREQLADLAAITYRGARKREHDRLAALESLEATLHWRIGVFR